MVNKGDREGADRALADLTAMLALASRPVPPLVKTVASTGVGVGELVSALELLRARPAAARAARRRQQAARQIVAIAGERARARAEAAIGRDGEVGRKGDGRQEEGEGASLASTVDAVAARTLDPWSAADRLLEVLS